jgi:hypothetical protein
MRRKIEVRELKKAAARWVFLSKNVFSKFYNTNDMTVAEAKAIIAPYVGSIQAQIKWFEDTDYFGADTRNGKETYGYKSDEHILSNLMYISDRFNCQFRLRWTLDLLEE